MESVREMRLGRKSPMAVNVPKRGSSKAPIEIFAFEPENEISGSVVICPTAMVSMDKLGFVGLNDDPTIPLSSHPATRVIANMPKIGRRLLLKGFKRVQKLILELYF
jgi:hypothetical protein